MTHSLTAAQASTLARVAATDTIVSVTVHPFTGAATADRDPGRRDTAAIIQPDGRVTYPPDGAVRIARLRRAAARAALTGKAA